MNKFCIRTSLLTIFRTQSYSKSGQFPTSFQAQVDNNLAAINHVQVNNLVRLFTTGCSHDQRHNQDKSHGHSGQKSSIERDKIKKSNESVSEKSSSLKSTAKKSSSSSSSSSSDSDDESTIHGYRQSKDSHGKALPSVIRSSRHVDEILSILEEPRHIRYGWLKVAFTIIGGIYFGAVVARIGASLLEEYEIFVKDDDDDD